MILEVGTSIRCRGIGAGTVVRHEEREFQGADRVFIVIEFPHRDMKASLPSGDPKVEHRLFPTLKVGEVRALIASIDEDGGKLMRTWEERERAGVANLRDGAPVDWARMLCDYACARRQGMQLAVSDVELIREAKEMLAAELSCASKVVSYSKALELVEAAYGHASAVRETDADEQNAEERVALTV
jgi:RNA polymerase-interacting CarD/CdnL/TRCF family regulator